MRARCASTIFRLRGAPPCRPTSAPRASTTVSSDAGKSKFDMTSTQERILEQYDVIVAGLGSRAYRQLWLRTNWACRLPDREGPTDRWRKTRPFLRRYLGGLNHVAKAAGIPIYERRPSKTCGSSPAILADDELMQTLSQCADCDRVFRSLRGCV